VLRTLDRHLHRWRRTGERRALTLQVESCLRKSKRGQGPGRRHLIAVRSATWRESSRFVGAPPSYNPVAPQKYNPLRFISRPPSPGIFGVQAVSCFLNRVERGLSQRERHRHHRPSRLITPASYQNNDRAGKRFEFEISLDFLRLRHELRRPDHVFFPPGAAPIPRNLARFNFPQQCMPALPLSLPVPGRS